ncbi:hypothetical protein HU200_050981 [Digitaria exilis]|uniref:Uncharacterized protein n=1 Tax=Digitaria exilis TaxID=1010633 RepID=A0A835AMY9_9POAL|nr:hypothetical protein HU200_050981 [Digitaria exilis]
MQKVIAQQLRLNYKTMAMFDEQDEEDDFNGVDLGSREAIRSVAIVIDRHLRESRFMMIFINGGDKEVVLGTLGIPQSSDNVIILWTFSARLVTMHTCGHLHEIERKLRYTDVFLWTGYLDSLPNSEFIALLHQEAANIIALYPLTSSIFLAFNNKHDPVELPNGYFKQYTNLAVLVLSCCAFNFLSPPFLHCHTLRFLGLDHCKHKNRVIELEEGGGCATTWAFLKSVHVIDLYYTEWVEILSEEKIKLMANLMELNIEGVRWPRCTINHQIQKKFNLQRLRIIMSTYNVVAETETTDIDNSFLLMDNTCLEIFDLSGSNINIIIGRNIAASISKARRLQVLILDGCDGLGDVMLPNNSSLRSFSFNAYGISE